MYIQLLVLNVRVVYLLIVFPGLMGIHGIWYYYKMEYINKKVAMGMIFLVVALFVISFVSGVAFKKIVLIAPGEEITEVIKLQNLNEGDPDLRFIGEITQGSEYVSFVGGNEWVVPNGEMGDAEMKISVPVSASVGDSYMISMTFRSVGEES